MNCVPGPLRLCPQVKEIWKNQLEDDRNPKNSMDLQKMLPVTLGFHVQFQCLLSGMTPTSSTQWFDECKEEGNGIPLAYAQVEVHESLFPTKHQSDILFLDFSINLCRPCLGVKSVEQTRGMKNRVWIIWDQIQTMVKLSSICMQISLRLENGSSSVVMFVLPFCGRTTTPVSMDSTNMEPENHPAWKNNNLRNLH